MIAYSIVFMLKTIKRTGRNFLLLILLSLILIASFNFVFSIHFTNSINEVKQVTLQRLMAFAENSIRPYIENYNNGMASRDETISLIAENLRLLTYREDCSCNYLFMGEYSGTFIMHPVIPQFEGRNMMDLQDDDGKYFIREIIEIAKTGSGFITYNYRRPDMDKPDPKMTYVVGIDELNSYIAIGLYSADVEKRSNPVKRRIIVLFFLLLAGLYLAAYMVLNPIIRSAHYIALRLENIDPETGIETLMDEPIKFHPNSETYKLLSRIQQISRAFSDKNNRLISTLQERNKLRDEHIRLIENSLTEKDLMLKEVNHRVKNNLQIIISLLKMQLIHTDNREIKESFIETINRLESISLIHDMLYSKGDYSSVSGKKYLEDLIEFLINSFGVSDRIEIQYEIEDVKIETDQAVTLGIITNEVITNSIKYAFGKSNNGIIRIVLKSSPNGNIFILSDNGSGIPSEAKDGMDRGLGINLIRSLSKQLHAELIIETEKGTSYKLIFS